MRLLARIAVLRLHCSRRALGNVAADEDTTVTPPNPADISDSGSPATLSASSSAQGSTTPAPAKKRLTAEQIEKRIRDTLAEYLDVRDKKVRHCALVVAVRDDRPRHAHARRLACTCSGTRTLLQELKLSIEELEVPDQYYTLVTLFFNEALSLKMSERNAAFEGLAFLLKEGPLTHAAVMKGYVPPPPPRLPPSLYFIFVLLFFRFLLCCFFFPEEGCCICHVMDQLPQGRITFVLLNCVPAACRVACGHVFWC